MVQTLGLNWWGRPCRFTSPFWGWNWTFRHQTVGYWTVITFGRCHLRRSICHHCVTWLLRRLSGRVILLNHFCFVPSLHLIGKIWNSDFGVHTWSDSRFFETKGDFIFLERRILSFYFDETIKNSKPGRKLEDASDEDCFWNVKTWMVKHNGIIDFFTYQRSPTCVSSLNWTLWGTSFGTCSVRGKIGVCRGKLSQHSSF